MQWNSQSTILLRAALARAAPLLLSALRRAPIAAAAQTDRRLPSWNDGPAKQAILDFVRATTDPASQKFVPPDERIATFDQDGTLWVEHPIYSQVVYCLDRVPALVKAKPELAKVEPFKTVLTGDREADRQAAAARSRGDRGRHAHRHDVETFQAEVKKWLAEAKDQRWKKPYTELTYQPMQEVLTLLPRQWLQDLHRHRRRTGFRARLFRTRSTAFRPNRWSARAVGTKFGYDKNGKPFLTKEPKLLLNDNNAGKPEGIHLMIGRRPHAAFGNSTGDRQMLEYTKAGDGARLSMLVLHDDAKREYAYGPAQGLPDTQGRHVPAGALRRGEEGRLDRHQHEGRLEADFRIRPVAADQWI